MHCEQAEMKLAQYLFDELNEAERIDVEAHLDTCDTCGGHGVGGEHFEEPPEVDDRAPCLACGGPVDDGEWEDNHGYHTGCAPD